MTFGTWRWWGCQPHKPAAFTPRKSSWCSFSLGAESTPGPRYGRKEICHWNIQWHHQESIPGPSRLVAQHLNHHATPGPTKTVVAFWNDNWKFLYRTECACFPSFYNCSGGHQLTLCITTNYFHSEKLASTIIWHNSQMVEDLEGGVYIFHSTNDLMFS